MKPLMKFSHGHARHARGFTLIELMIVVAIIAILAAIAYPSYQEHVRRTHRSSAKACLSEYAQFMERRYTSNLSYVGAVPAQACATEGNLNLRYTMTTGAITRTTYAFTAVPVAASSQASDTCGTLGIDQAGARTPTTNNCW